MNKVGEQSVFREGPLNQKHIGVVGGGAACACFLDALSQSVGASGGGKITVFEPTPNLWRGTAYQFDVDSIRVNIPPDAMAIRRGKPEHFEHWSSSYNRDGDSVRYLDERSGIRFLPRALFGEYLVESAYRAISELQSAGWQIAIIPEYVLSAAPYADGLHVRTDTDRVVEVTDLVLCVGKGTPVDVYGLSGVPGFFSAPYPLARTLPRIAPDASVGVLGSGLTAVDVVLALASNGHRGKIRLVSRSGRLPLVRQRRVSHELRHFTSARFRALAARGERTTCAEVFEIMQRELAEVDEDIHDLVAEIISLDREDPVRLLRRHIAEVDSEKWAMRILQQAVPAAGPDVWPLLPEPEQEAVLRKHYRTLMSICCPMPSTSAAKLLALIDAGQLEVLSGVENVEPAESGFDVRARGATTLVDTVVNAINVADQRIPLEARSLLDSLIAAGLAQSNPLGGIHVDRATSRLTVAGRDVPQVHAIGDLASGSLLFTFGLPVVVDRANDVAADLCGDDLIPVPTPAAALAGAELETCAASLRSL